MQFQTLNRVTEFNDLGVLYDNHMCFNKHIDAICSRATSRLGMIKRWSKEFQDPYIIKCLYVSLVRSVLEYGSCVWNPFYDSHCKKLESVQKQFLLFALRSLNWGNRLILPKYEHRLLLLDMQTLENRRIMLNVVFMLKLINGSINSDYLLNVISFKYPARFTRNFSLLYLNYSNVN